MRLSAASCDEAEEGEEDSGTIPLSWREQEELVKLREERILRAKEQMEIYEANTTDLKSGDYQVQIHIIEAQDMKVEGYGGASNPFVTIKCLGQIQKTNVRKGTNSCIFNEVKATNPSPQKHTHSTRSRI